MTLEELTFCSRASALAKFLGTLLHLWLEATPLTFRLMISDLQLFETSREVMWKMQILNFQSAPSLYL